MRVTFPQRWAQFSRSSRIVVPSKVQAGLPLFKSQATALLFERLLWRFST